MSSNLKELFPVCLLTIRVPTSHDMPSAVSATAVPTSTPAVIPKLIPRRKADAGDSSEDGPKTPRLLSPPDLSNHAFQQPVRRILSVADHELFLKSYTHELVVSFVFSLSDSVRNRTTRSVEQSQGSKHAVIIALQNVLGDAEELLKAHPRIETASRFGNPAFRDYLTAVESQIPKWHTDLGVVDPTAAQEVSAYLVHAFGSGARIDYGSGHELNFILWLLCLRQMSVVPDVLFPELALVVFPRYLRLMRDVQSTYYLEPAGSHGVWGLDDYQFLPFLFGASQLVGHKHIRPLSIHNELIIEECSQDYLYLDQIRWVNATKTVQGLRWHSPMLDDISAARSWAKVETGMRKMFLAEVLGKLPVAQHFLFGSLLPAEPGMTESRAVDNTGERDETGHTHTANSWGDCCGIKVPSAVGARQELAKQGASNELRRIPFD